MAPHSSTLAWKIPWMEEPGGLQSMGSLGVRHDWVTSLSLFTFMHWRRKWQPTPVFLLENPRDGGAWCAAISGVTQSWTRLKWLSIAQSHLTDKISLKLGPVWFRPSQRRYREKSASCDCSSWGWWGKEKDCQHACMPKSNKTAGQIWTPHQPPRGQMQSKKILWSFDWHWLQTSTYPF